MRQFFRRISSALTRDDLFLRVVGFLGGMFFGGLGVFMLVKGLTQNFSDWLSWFGLFYSLIAILLTGYGGLLLTRCVVPAKSRIAGVADEYFPNPAGLEDTAIVLVVCLIPAMLLTLALRLTGIKGQQTEFWNRPAKKKATKSKKTK